MFWRKREVNAPSIPSSYYHLARNMRGRYFSSDAIRQMLIRKGLSWENSFLVIHELDCEDDARQQRYFYVARTRQEVRRRLAVSIVLLCFSLLPAALDMLPGARLGFCATVGFMGAVLSCVPVVAYGLKYLGDY
jgi:hypothetical protein